MRVTGFSKNRIIIESAILIALATVLSIFKILPMPFGGTITIASMAPIVVISYRHGLYWGALSGLVYSLLQIVTGSFYPPPVQSFINYALVVLLDYIIAFGVLGVAVLFMPKIENEPVSCMIGAAAATLVRYLCHFASGILIWGSYAPEGQPVWQYSLIYNGSYMIPEIIVTVAAVGMICGFLIKNKKAVG